MNDAVSQSLSEFTFLDSLLNVFSITLVLMKMIVSFAKIYYQLGIAISISVIQVLISFSFRLTNIWTSYEHNVHVDNKYFCDSIFSYFQSRRPSSLLCVFISFGFIIILSIELCSLLFCWLQSHNWFVCITIDSVDLLTCFQLWIRFLNYFFLIICCLFIITKEK